MRGRFNIANILRVILIEVIDLITLVRCTHTVDLASSINIVYIDYISTYVNVGIH